MKTELFIVSKPHTKNIRSIGEPDFESDPDQSVPIVPEPRDGAGRPATYSQLSRGLAMVWWDKDRA